MNQVFVHIFESAQKPYTLHIYYMFRWRVFISIFFAFCSFFNFNLFKFLFDSMETVVHGKITIPNDFATMK